MTSIPRQRRVQLVTSWHEPEINAGIARYAKTAGWFLRDMSRSPQLLSDFPCDGIIAFVGPGNRELVAMLKMASSPVVNLCPEAIPGVSFPGVHPDNVAIGEMAAKHLLERGFRNLIFFSWYEHARVLEDRWHGFSVCARKNGVEARWLSFARDCKRSSKDAVDWIAAQLSATAQPAGVFGHYDVESEFIVYACLKANLHIPDQVGLVSVDNDYVHCELGPIPISSIDCDFGLIGYKAAELLAEMMNGGVPAASPVLIPPRDVVVRKSSDVSKIDIPSLRKAIEYIHQHFNENIHADAIAVHAGVSRRQLYRLFEDHLNRSVYKEIMNRRIAAAKRILALTGEKVEVVAYEAGFNSAEQFSKTFKKEVGVTPSRYRLEAAAKK